jgi:hypothetical protein
MGTESCQRSRLLSIAVMTDTTVVVGSGEAGRIAGRHETATSCLPN